MRYSKQTWSTVADMKKALTVLTLAKMDRCIYKRTKQQSKKKPLHKKINARAPSFSLRRDASQESGASRNWPRTTGIPRFTNAQNHKIQRQVHNQFTKQPFNARLKISARRVEPRSAQTTTDHEHNGNTLQGRCKTFTALLVNITRPVNC